MKKRAGELPFKVQVVTGLEGAAFLWRDILLVGRASTKAKTEARVERAIGAALRNL